MALSFLALVAAPLALWAGCVAEGPPTGTAGRDPEGQRGGPGPSPSPGEQASDPVLAELFEDDFDRPELGPDWRALSPAWRIEDGRLCARGARNRGVWLRRTIPASARIEVTAIAQSEQGDLKVELWGDGASGATRATYDDATSYLAIFGGWRNQRHVLARRDEHAAGRAELLVDPRSEDPRQRPVALGQPHRFMFERRDGRTLRWEVDGAVLFEVADDAPLRGAGHDHLGFNDWDAPVCFDDLRVEPLAPGEAPPRSPARAD